MPLKKIGSWSVSNLRILDEDGNVDQKLEPDLSPEQLVEIYRWMFLAREADQRMLKLQRQGRVGTFGPCTGQEACCVGAAYAMGEKDWFVGAFRELGGRLVRGEPLANGYIFHNGYEEGNVLPGGADHRMLPINIIVGSQNLHAAGIGYAMKYRGEKAAVVAFMGDGATSEGDFHEGLNFAGVWQAPCVFITQNNQWAISIPREKQTRSETLAQKAVAYGIHGIQVDGNDALAVFAATREALERAYAGEGPTLIEAVTYRLMMHTTADDPTKYRSEEETQEWWRREPLIRFRKYMEKKGIWDDAREEALAGEIKAQVDAAVREFEARTDYKPDAPFDHVYGEPVEEIEEQRREFLASLKEEAGDA
jgi:pyruvate dehydrogenase E1 component alpha subunit